MQSVLQVLNFDYFLHIDISDLIFLAEISNCDVIILNAFVIIIFRPVSKYGHRSRFIYHSEADKNNFVCKLFRNLGQFGKIVLEFLQTDTMIIFS